MQPSSSEYDVNGPNGGQEWYQSEGINAKGTTTFINFFCNDRSEVESLAHGLGIAKSITFHQEAVYIGRRSDYENGVG